MKNKLFILGMLPVLALVACNGTKKVDYAKFHEKAVEAAKEKAPKVKKAVYNGFVESEGQKFEVKNLKVTEDTKITDVTLTEAGFITAAALMCGLPVKIPEDKDATYYVGNGFKVKSKAEDGKGVMEWDKYLNVTKVKVESTEGNMDFTVKYSYEK